MKNKLKSLHQAGKLTPYLYQQVLNRVESLPEKLQNSLIKESLEMSEIGVNSEEDQKIFLYVLQHAKNIAFELTGHALNPVELAKLSHTIYQNREQFPINTILNFYRATGNALKKLQIPMKKMAYPQGDNGLYIEAPHNVQRWMQAMREI